MHLLRDEEIIALLEANPPLLTNFKKPFDWYSSDSIVQPSSLDLHVGKIFVPPTEKPDNPKKLSISHDDEYFLEPGQTVVVTTLEKLNVPKYIAIFGFPPTSISERAILMTNPGHIDPGFKGYISFTLINMGRQTFKLDCKKTKVATLLLVKLDKPVNEDYSQRYPRSCIEIERDRPRCLKLYKLGKDFLDLDNRAKKVAKKVVREENLNFRIGIPILTVLLTGLVTYLTSQQQFRGEIQNLESQINLLKNQVDFDQRLDTLEQLNSNNSEEE